MAEGITSRQGHRAIYEWLRDNAKRIPLPEGWIIEKVEAFDTSRMVEITVRDPANRVNHYRMRFEIEWIPPSRAD